MWLIATRSLALLAVASGCASTRLTPYTPQAIESYRNLQTRNGLAIAVHPTLEAEESTRHFGTDLPANNIIPVYVIVENRHPSLHFVLLRDRVVLSAPHFDVGSAAKTALSAPGNTEPPKPAPFAEAALPVPLGYTPIAVAVLVATPFLLAAEQQRRDAEAIRYQLKARELHNRTLAPGQSTGGFVFFQLAKDSKLPERWAIRLEASVAGSEETTRFEFDFTPEKTGR